MGVQNGKADSPGNWLQIRLFYSCGENLDHSMRIRWDVDRRTLGLANELENLLGFWNIEWAIKKEKDEKGEPLVDENGSVVVSEFIALRTQPTTENREQVKKKLEGFANQLSLDGLIQDYKFDFRTWLQSRKLPDEFRSWNEWFLQVRILNMLSKVIAEIYDFNADNYDELSRAKTVFFFNKKVIHHLNNMMHIQDKFSPIDLSDLDDKGSLVDVINLKKYPLALFMSRNLMLDKSMLACWSDIDFLKLRKIMKE